MKTKNSEKLIAVIGATGQQGGGVVRALQARFGFVRPNCSREQNSRQATEQVRDVGTPEFSGKGALTKET